MRVPKCDTCPIYQSYDESACGLSYKVEMYETGTSSTKTAWGKPIQDKIAISRNCGLKHIVKLSGAIVAPEYMEIE